MRKIDQVYRFGGDEFLVLFPKTTAQEAHYVLERLKEEFDSNFTNLNLEQEIEVDFSSGIAEMQEPSEDIDELLDKADQALYEVKQSGKGSVRINSQGGEARAAKEILIMDDENVIVDLVRTRLSSLGYNISYSNNGKEGVKLAKEEKPELIILDLMMPKINGFEVIRQLKDDDETRQIKIIVLSSKQSDKDIDRSFELGADDYLSKPFSLAELENRVKRII